MLKKSDILKQLEVFKNALGKPVTVHTSLKAIGEIEGGGQTLLDSLIEFFTADGGLLCVPTHTWDSFIYDMRKNDSCIGVLPRLAAADTRGTRTVHPSHSMAVFGDKKRVEEFVSNEWEVDTPTNPKGCYGKLYDEGGYILLIGVGQEKNTYIHCVEEMLGVTKRYTTDKLEFTVINKDNSVVKRHQYWFRSDEIPDVSKNFGKFEVPFRYFDAITDGKIGNASVQLTDCVKIKETLELIYKNANFRELLGDKTQIDECLYK